MASINDKSELQIYFDKHEDMEAVFESLTGRRSFEGSGIEKAEVKPPFVMYLGGPDIPAYPPDM